jgi:ATP-dependent RNA helicase MSS116
VLSARTAFPAARAGAASLPRPVAPLKSFTFLNRFYSSEAAVAEDVDAVPEVAATADAAGEISTFQDLETIGVHRNLLDAIIKDMGYDDMTPVQAKTIAPALKGTDM